MNTKKAGEYLDTPAQTLVTWRCTGRVKLTYVKIGGNVRYRQSDLDAFILANLRHTDDLRTVNSDPK
jgi:Helix-turn-helix domain